MPRVSGPAVVEAPQLVGAREARRLWRALVSPNAERLDAVNAYLVLSGARRACVLDDSFWDVQDHSVRQRFLEALSEMLARAPYAGASAVITKSSG